MQQIELNNIPHKTFFKNLFSHVPVEHDLFIGCIGNHNRLVSIQSKEKLSIRNFLGHLNQYHFLKRTSLRKIESRIFFIKEYYSSSNL